VAERTFRLIARSLLASWPLQKRACDRTLAVDAEARVVIGFGRRTESILVAVVAEPNQFATR